MNVHHKGGGWKPEELFNVMLVFVQSRFCIRPYFSGSPWVRDAASQRVPVGGTKQPKKSALILVIIFVSHLLIVSPNLFLQSEETHSGAFLIVGFLFSPPEPHHRVMLLPMSLKNLMFLEMFLFFDFE